MDFSTTLSTLKNKHLFRRRKTIQSPQGALITIDGRLLVNFCSNDYLSLANHPEVIEAFKKGVDKYGSGAASSHLLSGHSDAHQLLEQALADYTQQPCALLFTNGYMANLAVFSALKGQLDWVLQDKLNHASLIDANYLMGIPLQRYLHNNLDSLGKKVSQQTGKGLIVTERLFSMDGDQADIGAIAKIAQTKDALLMQDDAHGFGVFAPNIPNHSIYMATLGKAAGVMGAFVAGDEDFVQLLIQKSRPYIYTTAIAPGLCVAALKSLELIKKGEQTAKLQANIDYFKQQAAALKLPFADTNSAIFPLVIGSSERALNISKMLYQAGFYLAAIRPPTVPVNTARLRISLNANHTFAQIEQLLSLLNAI